MAAYGDRLNEERLAAQKTAVQQSTDPFSMATGGNTDPFYHSTGVRKDVTVNGVVYKNVIDVGTTKPPAAKGIGSISPASGLVITGDERSAAKEAESMRMGVTKEYIASRGGINSMGYYNDTPLNSQLNAAEYKSVTKPDGTIDSAAMWNILNAKQGGKLGPFTGQDLGGGSAGGSAGGKGGGYDANGNKVAGGQYDANGNQVAGVIPTVPSAETMQKRTSAWATLKAEFEKYNLGGLADAVKNLILDGASTDEVTLKLRATPEYVKRFAGNQERMKAGLNVYDEGTYLALENAYAEAFTSYGQQGLLGKTADEKQANFATYIGGTIAPTEIKRRLQVATDLAASDSATKAAIKQLYPMITDGDLVAYFLKPSETLPKLEVKAQAAKIGGAFLKQGLATDAVSAEEYVAAGVTEEQAQAGAAAVAEVLPRGEFLSDITAGAPDYTQKTAEEVYLKGLASAKRAQDQLRQAEIGRFSGSSGTNKTSLSEQKFGLI